MTPRPHHPRHSVPLLHALTFIVALCSFAYELVFAELYTVVFGGSVTQYGLTIGLFFSSLGLGSFLSGRLETDPESNFFRVETYLAVVAPLGFLLVILLGTLRYPAAYAPLVGAIARLPIVTIGFLSGFELPLLTTLSESVRDTARPPSSIARGVRRLTSHLNRAFGVVLGAAFSIKRREGKPSDPADETSAYAAVLGFDYLGGLVGSLVYVFFLYPAVGLIPSVFVLAFLNGVAALIFASTTANTHRPTLRSRLPQPVGSTGKALFAVCLLVTASTGAAAVNAGPVGEDVSEYYFEREFELEYAPGAMDVAVTDTWTTRYQRVTEYNRTWTGSGDNPYFGATTEHCLRLDSAVQLCESWADSYHQGLVDVPLSMFENSTDTKVLLIGGGDWAAMDRLQRHGVSVDHVDIDGEFMQRAKTDPFLAQYHDRAYRYENKSTRVQDAFQYLEQSEQRYDVILLDIPGATDDDQLPLYSVEFYSQLRQHLTADGVIATWTYSRYSYAQHRTAYYNTVHKAGLTSAAPYFAWEDIDADGETERVERFTLLAPAPRDSLSPHNGTAYMNRYQHRYQAVEWVDTPRYAGVRPNSVFHPNYDILIK
ncbi:spermidine synthase [Haloarcula marismortui]|uniref:Spermidine synthase n=1 Tax=Haloarcula marismortui ATCC 33800 TaxID=662476 RepID=M0JJM4_9EURY|nr:spermidine synthase [Haloarcula sinaiiensis]EMA07900.1 spermidine synthase [Haloarcula sinaiiensis ATCC 33800]QUJ73897.1 spermidine synthase [Haloarcula sinaiiensis ATCC 33800]